MSSKKKSKSKNTTKKNIAKKNTTPKRIPIAEIILVMSALFLGVLIVILVAKNKTHTVIEPTRVISGDYTMPYEVVEEDKLTYFAYMDIPDMIFKKMQ